MIIWCVLWAHEIQISFSCCIEKSGSPHVIHHQILTGNRGTEITLSETSEDLFFIYFLFFLVISMFATCPLSPCPQCSRTHFHGNFFTGLLGRRHCQGYSACDCECLSLALVQMVLLGPLPCLLAEVLGQCPCQGLLYIQLHHKYMNHKAQLICTRPRIYTLIYS